METTMIASRNSLLMTIGLAAVLSITAAVSTQALDNARQLLVAGNAQGEAATQFAGPGMSNVYGVDFPNTGQGEQAASIRMSAGSLSNLRVNVVTATVPASGMLRVKLRINGADTAMTCMVTGTGICNRTSAVSVATNDLVTLMVYNTFVGSGVLSWTATIEYD